mgnify:CR=1 FL=1
MGMGGGGSSGGGGGQAAQSSQYGNISPWAQPYVGALLGAGQAQVFQTNPTDIKDAEGNTISTSGPGNSGVASEDINCRCVLIPQA